MAFTAAEEALVRLLLAQQAEILSLAGNEATIISKLGATKKTLSDLNPASAVNDTDLLFVRQGISDKTVTPLLLRTNFLNGMATQKGVQAGDYNTAHGGGTADAITGDYTPNITALEDGLILFVRAASANTTTTPTFSPDGLTAKTIVKGANKPLVPGDIDGAGNWLEFQYDLTLDKWVLLNPATGANLTPVFGSLIAANGYQKFPSGLIIQWGITGDIPVDSNLTVTLPIAFPNGILAASCNPSNWPTAANTTTGSWSVFILSASQISVNNRTDINSGVFHWIVIGY